MEEQITRGDPFCIVMPFPCGPWNSLTYVNMARFPEVAERTYETQAQHIPMLKVLARLAVERIRKGRI
eukprot:9953718-Prorocentrum_lima.AAC.1